MGQPDHRAARNRLEREFERVDREALGGTRQQISERLGPHFDRIFESSTQAYREVLVGCVLARLLDKAIDVHRPYLTHGEDAYSGRSLDEKVVNPFLKDHNIPSSKGPFLSTFRRSVGFVESTREGLRDKEGFDSLLALIDYLAEEREDDRLARFLRYLLYRFWQLRNEAEIPVSRLQRISLEQYDSLLTGLLDTPSGGRFPVLLVEATFRTLNDHFNLGWEIQSQGINVADGPSGLGGDITVLEGDSPLLVAEITERRVDRNRVVTTFQTKISKHSIEDYLFFIKDAAVEDNAIEQAKRYFSQGHEVNFIVIRDWIRMVLATIGKKGRDSFCRKLTDTLDRPEVPSGLKEAWNNQIAHITAG